MPNTLYAYIWRVSARSQIVLSLIAAAIAGLSMLPLELQRRIVDDAIKGSDAALLVKLALVYAAVLAVQNGLKFVSLMLVGRVNERVIRNLRDAVYRCVFMIRDGTADPKQKEQEQPDRGTVVSMVSAEVETLGNFVGEGVSFPLLQFGTVAVIAAFMFAVEPTVAALAFALYLPQVVLVPLVQGAINRRGRERAEQLREAGDFIVNEAELAAPKDPTPRPYRERIERIFRLRVQIYWLKAILKLISNLIRRFAPLGVLAIGGLLVIDGRAELGVIVAFLSGLERIGEPIRELMGFYRRVSDARVRYQMLVEALPPMPQDSPVPGLA